MGLASSFIAYQYGKRRASKKARQRESGAPSCLDPRCDDYNYCKNSGYCSGDCTYENIDE